MLEDSGFPFSPDGSLFGPAGGDIDEVDSIGEHAGEGIAAVRDGISFEEAGAGFIPLVGLDRDLLAKEGSGFGGGAASFFVVDAGVGEDAVDGGGGDLEQGLGDFWGQGAEEFVIAGDPDGEDGLKSF